MKRSHVTNPHPEPVKTKKKLHVRTLAFMSEAIPDASVGKTVDKGVANQSSTRQEVSSYLQPPSLIESFDISIIILDKTWSENLQGHLDAGATAPAFALLVV
ncbi:hypothetical protein HYALB_00007957 [Hymenoscyphus albidus]|uniref:Uncharacterized protein n=1 Tax=Hymenoscyphus albidus TaxID=595503 RepID=A0A9N9Q5A9_9HELO|nr:hypothetical protein HYALB_00007957 [Hymenoscyphus albidus]